MKKQNWGTTASTKRKIGIAKKHGFDSIYALLHDLYDIKKISATKIAAEIGVCQDTVYNWLRAEGITKNLVKPKAKKFSACKMCGKDKGVNYRICSSCLAKVTKTVETASGYDLAYPDA